jgi:hypothetical protein
MSATTSDRLRPTPATTATTVLASAPEVPPGFFGDIVFTYEHGKLVVARINQTIKPQRDSRTP